jgi:hypothetical protein
MFSGRYTYPGATYFFPILNPIRCDDSDARAPGVNNGMKAPELVVAGGALVLTGVGVDL